MNAVSAGFVGVALLTVGLTWVLVLRAEKVGPRPALVASAAWFAPATGGAVKPSAAPTGVTCDRCGAGAGVEVVTPAGVLAFCGHHARVHEVTFADRGYLVSATPAADAAGVL